MCFFLLHTENQNSHSTSKVRTFSGNEDILARPYTVRRLFEGLRPGVRVEFRTEFAFRFG